MKQNVQELKQRIKELMLNKRINQRKLAESIGVTPAAVTKWLSSKDFPDAKPSVDNIEKIAAVLDTTASYLLFGGVDSIDRPIKLEDGYVLIPHLNVAASCGTGELGMDKPLVKFIKVSTEWLRSHTPYSNHSALNVIVASGDSMSPTVQNGDMVIVDTSETHVKTDALYVFVKEGEIFLKRVQRLASGLRVISDNPRYPPFDLSAFDLEQFKIVGRVCCVGNFKEV